MQVSSGSASVAIRAGLRNQLLALMNLRESEHGHVAAAAPHEVLTSSPIATKGGNREARGRPFPQMSAILTCQDKNLDLG